MAYPWGFVAGLFSCPPEQRFDLISTPEEDQVAIAELGLSGVGEPLTTFLRSSLLTQLRTCPVGIHPRGSLDSHQALRLNLDIEP